MIHLSKKTYIYIVLERERYNSCACNNTMYPSIAFKTREKAKDYINQQLKKEWEEYIKRIKRATPKIEPESDYTSYIYSKSYYWDIEEVELR